MLLYKIGLFVINNPMPIAVTKAYKKILNREKKKTLCHFQTNDVV